MTLEMVHIRSRARRPWYNTATKYVAQRDASGHCKPTAATMRSERSEAGGLGAGPPGMTVDLFTSEPRAIGCCMLYAATQEIPLLHVYRRREIDILGTYLVWFATRLQLPQLNLHPRSIARLGRDPTDLIVVSTHVLFQGRYPLAHYPRFGRRDTRLGKAKSGRSKLTLYSSDLTRYCPFSSSCGCPAVSRSSSPKPTFVKS